VCCNVVVFVPVNIAGGSHLPPADAWMSLLQRWRQAAGRFRNDLKAASHSVEPHQIAAKIFE